MDYKNRSKNSGFSQLVHNVTVISDKQMSKILTSNKGWLSEIYIKKGNARGFLDLYDNANEKFYEVKSNSPRNVKTGLKQMQKYDGAVIPKTKGNIRAGVTKFSRNIKPGDDSNIKDSFYYGFYDVSYYYSQPGLILYDVKPNMNRVAETLGCTLLLGTIILLPCVIPEVIVVAPVLW